MSCSPMATGSLPLGGSTRPAPSWQAAKYTRAPKPAGGFALLPLEALLLPWLAHEQGLLEPLALRGYLACIEMRERRCQVTPETALSYTTEELRRLLGAAVRPRAAVTVRQLLCTTGLIAWPDEGQQCLLCPHGTAVSWLDHARYTTLRAAIHPSVQQIPLPRRLVSWLAQHGAPGLIATVLGVACRTLRYRGHQVHAGGSVIPAWVARTFQVPRRTVAHWLHRLRALHWLARVPTPPAHRAFYGPWVAINLQWAPPTKAHPDKNLATPPRLKRKNLATPRKNLATLPTPQTSEPLNLATPSPTPYPLHDNPVPETQPLKNHENPDGDCALAQGRPLSGADPTTYYATLAPDIQARLYHDAEARLLEHYPADFVIRPAVMAEVYRLLEPPRPLLAMPGNTCSVPALNPLLLPPPPFCSRCVTVPAPAPNAPSQ